MSALAFETAKSGRQILYVQDVYLILGRLTCGRVLKGRRSFVVRLFLRRVFFIRVSMGSCPAAATGSLHHLYR
jgi:hypothetical protein